MGRCIAFSCRPRLFTIPKRLSSCKETESLEEDVRVAEESLGEDSVVGEDDEREDESLGDDWVGEVSVGEDDVCENSSAVCIKSLGSGLKDLEDESSRLLGGMGNTSQPLWTEENLPKRELSSFGLFWEGKH